MRSKNSLSHLALILILAGDIVLNPVHSDNCSVCDKQVLHSHPAIQCDDCKLWTHARCCDISDEVYQHFQCSDNKWNWPKCVLVVFNSDPAIEYDDSKTWVHTKCTFFPRTIYIHAANSLHMDM